MKKNKPKRSLFDRLFESKPESGGHEDKAPKPELQPALLQIGVTDCSICGREVAVFLTKTHRPYANCGFCLARTFYNGRESMRLLKKKMRPVEE